MKKLWNENRVLFLLIVILCVCFIAIVAVALTFFYSKDVGSYGTRLDGIEKYPITKKIKNNYQEKVLENEGVTKVSINTRGRVVYIHITFDETIDVEDAKKIAESSLELIDEDLINFYDIDFVLKSDNYVILGAKNTTIDFVSWNNNREIEEEEEVKDEK